MIAATRWSVHGGTFGALESNALAAAMQEAVTRRTPIRLELDSAGARIPEGLTALAAFRRLYRAALQAAAAGVLDVCEVGEHCFGGASMLAMLCSVRRWTPGAALAMSGPAIIAAASRAPLDTARRVVTGEMRQLLDVPVPLASDAAHALLATRLTRAPEVSPGANAAAASRAAEVLGGLGFRRVRLATADGVAWGDAVRRAPLAAARKSVPEHQVIAVTSGRACGARMAWRIADVLRGVPAGGALLVLLDCPAHSAALADESVLLSAYLAHAALLLRRRGEGRESELLICGEAAGGIYVALAAAVAKVSATRESKVRILPVEAVAALAADLDASLAPALADARAAGAIDHVFDPRRQ